MNTGDIANIRETAEHDRKKATLTDYRGRILSFIVYIATEYPQYYDDLVIELGPNADDPDTGLRYFGYKRDLRYGKLSSDLVKSFMAKKKIKKFILPKGEDAARRALAENPTRADKLFSHVHVRKYHDAILWGAEQVGFCLSSSYQQDMKKFLDNYKKEFQSWKDKGLVSGSDADPFSFSLYHCVCVWLLTHGYIFGWFFLICQWNCMARSINIDGLSLNHLRMGASDSIVIKFDKTKKDQSGENCFNKNIFANPLEPYICFFLGLGVYCSIESEKLSKGPGLFLKVGAAVGSASKTFCDLLLRIVREFPVVVAHHVRVTRFNAHGVRKGAGTYSVSCSTVPPPLVSIAHRGDWSMGKVFDIYFNFGTTGDSYLGRVLTGLDPNSDEFAILPPHFKNVEEVIEEGLCSLFDKLPEVYPDLKGVWMFGLASVVYHSDFLLNIMVEYPGNPISQIPLLQNPELLAELKKVVSMTSCSKMKATGVPPHVEQMSLLRKVYTQLCAVIGGFESQTEKMVLAVREAINSNDVRSGNLTLNTLEVSNNFMSYIFIFDLY